MLSATQVFGLLFAAAMLSSLITLLVMHLAFTYSDVKSVIDSLS